MSSVSVSGSPRSGRWAGSLGRGDRLWWLAIASWASFILLEALIDPAIVPMAVVWAGNGMLLMVLLRVCLERAPARGGLRLVVFVIATVTVAIVQTALDQLSAFFFGEILLSGLATPPPGTVLSPLEVSFGYGFRISFRIYLWIYGFFAAAVALQGLARDELRAREESFTARIKAQKAELDALRLQVNPHFLFNALNSLASEAQAEKAGKTERLALGLARYYRGSFVEIDRDILPLGEELENVQAFLELESQRLRCLAFTIDCPDALLCTPVPAMILQPLVENAVKYGVAGHDAPPPVRITVRSTGDGVEIVCESGVSPFPDPSGTGRGLLNVERRLDNAYGKRASLVRDSEGLGWRVTVTMPLIEDDVACG